jgi:hypothetical protein
MKSIKRFLQAAALAVVCAVFANDANAMPSKGNMIPDKAVMAVKVSPDQLFNKALGDEMSPVRAYWNMLKSALYGELSELGSVGETAKQYLKNPALFGINLVEPVVVSCTCDMESFIEENPACELYAVALLDDRDAFINIIDLLMAYAGDAMPVPVTKEELTAFYTYYDIYKEDEVSVDLAVTANAAILRLKVDPTQNFSGLKASMLNLFLSSGPAKTEGLKAFYAVPSDFAIWMNLDGAVDSLMPLLAEAEPEAAAAILPYVEMYEGSSCLIDLNFLPGKTVLSTRVFGSDVLKENMTKYFTVPSDKYLKSMPASSAAVVNLAIKDFDALVKDLCAQNVEVQTLFEELEAEYGFDKALLAGFPGTLTLAAHPISVYDQYDVAAKLCVECDGNVWEYAELYLDVLAENAGPNKYLVEDQVYVTYADDRAALEYNWYHPVVAEYSFAETELAAQIKNGGCVINLAAFPDELLLTLFEEFAEELGVTLTRQQILDICSSIVYSLSDDFMGASFTLNMNDKEHNLLEKALLTIVQNL